MNRGLLVRTSPMDRFVRPSSYKRSRFRATRGYYYYNPIQYSYREVRKYWIGSFGLNRAGPVYWTGLNKLDGLLFRRTMDRPNGLDLDRSRPPGPVVGPSGTLLVHSALGFSEPTARSLHEL
ncbi:hypothetical protein BDR22DRAFT_825704 [Usnea florida]